MPIAEIVHLANKSFSINIKVCHHINTVNNVYTFNSIIELE